MKAKDKIVLKWNLQKQPKNKNEMIIKTKGKWYNVIAHQYYWDLNIQKMILQEVHLYLCMDM